MAAACLPVGEGPGATGGRLGRAMGLVIGSRPTFGSTAALAGGRVPLGDTIGAAGGLKEPVGLAAPVGGVADLAVESLVVVDGAGGVFDAAGGGVDVAGGVVDVAGGVAGLATAPDVAGAPGVAPSESARRRGIFGSGRVSAAGLRFSEDAVKVAFWAEFVASDSVVVVPCCGGLVPCPADVVPCSADVVASISG